MANIKTKNVFFQDKKMSGADAATFIIMREYENTTQELYFAKDKTSVFWKDKKVNGADLSSFKGLDMGYGADNKHIFYHTAIVKDADPHSFKIYPHRFGDADAEDKNNKYGEGKKVAE